MTEAGDSLHPLTASQSLIWTGQRLQPDDPLYNMVLSFEIHGEVDPELFQQTFQALVDRCDALRMVVDGTDDSPALRFLPAYEYNLEIVDLATSADPDEALRAWVDEHVGLQFDLATCLFESALIKLGPARYCWYFNQHHLATDASTTAILYRQMQAFYALARRGQLDQVPELPAYREYLRHEQAERQSPAYARAKTYWDKALETPFLATTFYRPIPADRSGRTERSSWRLESERSARLKALAAEDDFRAFTVDLAQFQIFATALFAFMHRISGNRQLALGAPTHNRVTPDQKETPGLFIEVFPLQVSIDSDDRFLDLYRKVARSTQQFFINTTPGLSGPEHNRAYDVLLNYITAEFCDFDGMPMRSDWVHAGYGDRNHLFRLQVHDFDRDDSFLLHFDMNVDTFSQRERDDLVGQFLRLLDAFLEDPARQIAAVPLLSAEEWTSLNAEVNGIDRNRSVDRTIVELFRSSAASCGDKTALICDQQTLSYAELDQATDRLAARLRGYGAGPGAVVAICMARSIEAVIAILGVLKTGAAYLPLDPEFPDRRIAMIVDDAAVSLMLSQSALSARLPGEGIEVLYLDSLQSELLTGPVDTPAPAGPDLSDSCYLIYTSGSTGRPKGVVVKHRGLANYIEWARDYYLRGEPHDFALFTTLTFDLTVTSIFVPLISGNCLIVYPEPECGREIMIQKVVEDNAADIIKLTPSHLALLQNMDLSSSRIKKLIVGGEDLKTELARTIVRRFGGNLEIYNEYGPTEATVACMIHRFDPARDRESSVPIGHSIDNLQVYVLDAFNAPLPAGVVGELFIGGLGVADGYLNAPELTAQRFIDDPFSPGAKMYASGDLARVSGGGCLQYLGRRDQQVKIRGVRVELAEIETALLQLPEISACVVTARESTDPGADTSDEVFCVKCGLSALHPDAQLDSERICAICRSFEADPGKAHGYFGTMDDLQAIVDRARSERTGQYDCVALLSGGKDSSYALCRLVELGLKPLVFTLDNGYISDGARANIRLLVDSLGLDLHTGSTPAMNEIFVDSLNRHSNVCNGCFKTIYTLSMNLAHEHGIRYIMTGLSRGQIFESRLADLFRHRIFDPEEIDRNIVAARMAYHRLDDVIARELNTELFRDDAVFNEIQFVDFYRYCNVGLDEVLDYLDRQVGWIRPPDTGRSTNCLINEAGIYVHKSERGFHNYSLPYSWDVRLGHKQRDAARMELQDNIDVVNVERILGEIGYQGNAAAPVVNAGLRLLAYYVASSALTAADIKAVLSESLPQELVPTRYMRIDQVPLNANGKVDLTALPEPDDMAMGLDSDYAAPENDVERLLADIWSEVIGVGRVGRDDNFFDLGGDSILNIHIVARAKNQGIAITPQQIFDYPTIAQLAGVVGSIDSIQAEQAMVTGTVALTPIQKRFFEAAGPKPRPYSQVALFSLPADIDSGILAASLEAMLQHHDGLRSRFERREGVWIQTLDPVGTHPIEIESIDVDDQSEAQIHHQVDAVAARLHRGLNIETGPLCRFARIITAGVDPDLLLMVVHHLVIDGVSWWILLEDLQTACRQLSSGEEAALPAKTSSVAAWSEALHDYADSPVLDNELEFWLGSSSARSRLPRDHDSGRDNDLAEIRSVSVTLDSRQTHRLLHEVPGIYSTQVPDLLLTALTGAFHDWTGESDLYLDLEGHGREEIRHGIDLLRTIGWFTTVYPVRLRCDMDMSQGRALMATKEHLRATPKRGIGYGVLRYLGRDQEAVRRLQQAPAREVLFNYLGQWGQSATEGQDIGFARPLTAIGGDPQSRLYALEINAVVFSDRLTMDFTYNAAWHAESTITALANNTIGRVDNLISHCLSSGEIGLTPSDFPQADLNQADLDDLIAEFGEQ